MHVSNTCYTEVPAVNSLLERWTVNSKEMGQETVLYGMYTIAQT